MRSLFTCLALAVVLRAGVQYPAKPGEAVVANQYIVKLKPGVDSSIITWYMPLATIVKLRALNLQVVKLPSTQSQASAQSLVNSLASDALVQYVEPNKIRHFSLASPNDAAYTNPGSQWNLQAVNAFAAWNALPNASYLTSSTANAARVAVADIDTGADCTHPDFMNFGGTSADSAQGGQLLFNASMTSLTTAVNPAACAWQDDHGHGTHTAGTIAAATNNGSVFGFNGGVASLGYPLQLVIYKGLGADGTGDDASLANLIMAAADAGIRVVSASWGDAAYSQVLQDAVTYAWQRNTLFVAAAGNNGFNKNGVPAGTFYPAGSVFAVGVGASDITNNIASFSNNGDWVRISAPGVNIYSTMPTYNNTIGALNYANLSGTSMATPHVAALAGLLLSEAPNASSAAILQRIQQSAFPSTANGGWTGDFGYGIINAANALTGVLRSDTTGGLTGQVVDSKGNLIAANLIATASGQPAITTTADVNGKYRFANIPAGTYQLSVSATGYTTLSTLTATIAPGADTILPITIDSVYAGFTGSVTAMPASASSGVIVQALSSGLIAATTVTDKNGKYTMWVAPGTYDITASSLAFNPVTVPGQSTIAGTPTTVNLSLTSTESAAPVTIMTNPPGLSVIVDGVAYTAPHFFAWTQGSQHTLDTSSSQGSATTRYLLNGWSNSIATHNQTVTVTGAASYTANFTTQYYLTTGALPSNEGTVSPASGFYNAGTQVTVTATPNTGYQFNGFTGDNNATTSPQVVTMSAPRSVTANFSTPAVRVYTVPSGLAIVIDGFTYNSPQLFQWNNGTNHTMNVTPTQGSGTTQYVFTGWTTDSTPLSNPLSTSQAVTMTGTATYTANFKTQYQLSEVVTPGGAGTISPVAGFYDAGSTLNVTALPAMGYNFSGFTGDLMGTTNPQTLVMSSAHSITANFTPNTSLDLALGKVATQSSTLLGYGAGAAASSAVDGKTDGNFANGSVAHTSQESTPWWQVDLGTSVTVGSVVLWNRTDCCSDRLSDYWVFVSNTPFLITDTPSTLQSRAGTWSSHQTSYPNPSSSIPVNYQGRYVRVQLSGYNYLSLAEVQVFGLSSVGSTYAISGQVTLNSVGLNGVMMTLSGAENNSTTTSGTGNYSFSSLTTGTVTVTPTLSGYTFTPPSQTFTNLSANQTLNFTATAVVVSNDLALGRPATQSSTLAGFGPTSVASSAVDGNTDGNFYDGSVSHTNAEAYAWWQVDLGASATIGSVAIWNRTDCCQDRLNDYWVFVSNTPFLATDTPATLSTRAGTWSSHQTSYPNPSSTINVNASGRYVRVQLSGANYLNLAEVQVFGSASQPVTYGISGQVTLSGVALNGVAMTLSGSQSGSATTAGAGTYTFASLPASGNYTVTPSLSGYTFTPPSATFSTLSGNQTANFAATAVANNDLALGRTATQSSALAGYGSISGPASAVDGNTDGNFFDGSVSHTNFENTPWWQVDLGSAATIGSVVIWNRTDCCSDRMSDYWVFVSNTPFLSTDTPATLQVRAGTWSIHQTSYPNPSATIPVNTSGRYVRIQLSGTNYLNLAEVQVFGSATTPVSYGISGSVTLSGAGLSGVTMTLGGTQNGTAATSASGSYSFSSLAASGSYTVTPTLSGYTFTPPTQTVANLGANQTFNFTATANVSGNLALGKTASESSVLQGFGPTSVASSAVDGNTDGNYFDGSVAHTNPESMPWWQVDLGASFTVTSVVVWNRTDCCTDRLNDYWIFVSNTPFLSTDTPATLSTRAGTFAVHQTSSPNPSSSIPVNAAGRYVRVQLSGFNYLNLAEVQVFGH